MKTRFSPLIKIKKELMDRCERNVQQANQTLQNARNAVEEAYQGLKDAEVPATGSMASFKNSRMMIASQRELIEEKKEWLAFAEDQLLKAKEAFKAAMIEYEKFKYLEAQQIKEMVMKKRKKEQLMLDEIAVQRHQREKGSA